MTSPSQPEASALDALLDRYPQLNTPQVSRRALLAMSSLLALDLTGCGSSDDDSVASSGGGGGGSGSTTPAPTITSFTPSSGSTAGGTLVTINGTNLTGASTVMFGGTAASSFTVVSSNQITATAPAHAAGAVTPSIITPGGTAVATANFTYIHSNAGVVSTWAGQAGNLGSANGTGTGATFYYPKGVAVDSSGNLYVADYYNNQIRKITPLGVVSTWAGGGSNGHQSGSIDGTGTGATFSSPQGVAVDASGNVYVADYNNHLIRKIDANRVVTTLAGDGTNSWTDGTGTAAQFNGPSGVAVDASGNLYVADSVNAMVRKIDTNRVVTTLAGSTLGFADGTGTAALFYDTTGIAIDSSGNLYVAENSVNRIRKITMPGAVVSTWAGSTTATLGSADGTGTAATFNAPSGVAVDPNNGNLYVADSGNSMIRRIDANRVVSTWAGQRNAGTGSADGTGTAASFQNPVGIAVDANSYIYVADTVNETIRKIS